MRRVAYTAGAVAFAGLTVAVVALWVRGDRIADSAGLSSSTRASLALGLRTTVREFGCTSGDALAARRGLCRRCGYDLRGTPDRCPECGAVNKVADAVGGRPADRR